MSEIMLSFEQLREDIFDGVLKSLERTSYSDLHTAILSGKDPRQMLIPRPEDAMMMGKYGTLNLLFNIPDEIPISLSIVLTMGRVAYTVQTDSYIAENANLISCLHELGEEMGLNCVYREVGNKIRFEFSTTGGTMSTDETLNILGSPQVEFAFKESVLLQVDRLVIGIANIIGDAGMLKSIPPGFFAICVIRRADDEVKAESILSEYFQIIAKDARDPLNVVYGLISIDENAKPMATCGSVEFKLRQYGFSCAFRPTWKYSPIEQSSYAGDDQRIEGDD
jgi:hypothetical protein